MVSTSPFSRMTTPLPSLRLPSVPAVKASSGMDERRATTDRKTGSIFMAVILMRYRLDFQARGGCREPISVTYITRDWPGRCKVWAIRPSCMPVSRQVRQHPPSGGVRRQRRHDLAAGQQVGVFLAHVE